MLGIELRGTEAFTVELEGTVPLAQARACLGAAALPLETREADPTRAVVSVLLFQMRGMRARGLPGPVLDYAEALWRVGVLWRGAPAWFAVACDLDSAAVRALGAVLVRYPTRAARLAVDAEGARVERVDAAARRFAVRATAVPARETPPPVPPRPLLVPARRGSGALYRIPWREEPAPERRVARCEVSEPALARATLGEGLAWAPEGLVHSGRTHICGVASRARG